MSRAALTAVLQAARTLVGSTDEALARELDGHLTQLRLGPLNPSALATLFLPTGPLQELALDGGWGDVFLELADAFDAAAAADAGVARARTTCAICGLTATVLDLDAEGLRRESFTGTLAQPLPRGPGPALRAAVAAGDARALHAVDPELVPCFCPECGQSYCGEHWTTRDVFDDDGFHDAIRGTCPEGHERLLED